LTISDDTSMSIDDVSSHDGSLLSEESNSPSPQAVKLPLKEDSGFFTVFTNIGEAFGDWEQ
jgi:hypothetical protein